MQEPDWAAVENTLVNALANLDLADVEKQGSVLLEGYEPWDALWKGRGIGVSVTVSQDTVGVSVQGPEGDTDLAWSGPLADFNEEGQAEAANLALAAMAGYFHAE